MIVQNEIPKFSMIDPNGQIEIESENSKVYSVSNGKIISVLNLSQNEKSIIVRTIKNGINYFYVYSNFEKVNFKKGDLVKKNEVLGELKLYENKYVLRFEIRKNSKKINPKNYLKCKIKSD